MRDGQNGIGISCDPRGTRSPCPAASSGAADKTVERSAHGTQIGRIAANHFGVGLGDDVVRSRQRPADRFGEPAECRHVGALRGVLLADAGFSKPTQFPAQVTGVGVVAGSIRRTDCGDEFADLSSYGLLIVSPQPVDLRRLDEGEIAFAESVVNGSRSPSDVQLPLSLAIVHSQVGLDFPAHDAPVVGREHVAPTPRHRLMHGHDHQRLRHRTQLPPVEIQAEERDDGNPRRSCRPGSTR